LKSKQILEKTDADKIVAAATGEAQKNQWAVAIAVVDDGGHLLAFTRLDNTPSVSCTIAIEKARTSAIGKRESKVYEDMINNGRTSFLSVVPLQGMLEGGVPIMVDGQCVGAVGVSGVKSVEDAQVAKVGVAALG